MDTMTLLLGIVAVGLGIAVVLVSATRVARLLGSRGQRILLRFMGLILAAVGAQLLLAGVHSFVLRS
jgi:small neutral amino acid transporter SnatA (MarC family)